MSITKHWYAVYTKPRAEKKAALALTELGIEHYLPLQTSIKQWSDRKKKVEEPLFKSYLFVYINLELSQQQVTAVPSIVKFVKIGQTYTTIRLSIIDAIKTSLMHFSEMEITNEHINTNTKVSVIAGPLKGYKGTTITKQGSQYFALQIEELGTHMLIKVPTVYLKKE